MRNSSLDFAILIATFCHRVEFFIFGRLRLSDLSVDNRVEWYKNCWRRASYHCRLSNGRDGNARGEGTRPVASHLAVALIKKGVQRQGVLACLCTPYGGAIVPRVDSCGAASRLLRCCE